jgi:uncharacterized protein YndB with AHSA1/START domain
MTARSTEHSTIVLERIYEASPQRVFAAWSNKEALLRWGRPGDGWEVSIDRFEFKVGGGELSSFGPRGGDAPYVNETRYLDIVANERIISAGVMAHGEARIFAGMLTVEFHAAASGCRMVMTEQGVFLDGHDIPANHQAGWNAMLDNLGEELRRDRAAA